MPKLTFDLTITTPIDRSWQPDIVALIIEGALRRNPATNIFDIIIKPKRERRTKAKREASS